MNGLDNGCSAFGFVPTNIESVLCDNHHIKDICIVHELKNKQNSCFLYSCKHNDLDHALSLVRKNSKKEDKFIKTKSVALELTTRQCYGESCNSGQCFSDQNGRAETITCPTQYCATVLDYNSQKYAKHCSDLTASYVGCFNFGYMEYCVCQGSVCNVLNCYNSKTNNSENCESAACMVIFGELFQFFKHLAKAKAGEAA